MPFLRDEFFGTSPIYYVTPVFFLFHSATQPLHKLQHSPLRSMAKGVLVVVIW